MPIISITCPNCNRHWVGINSRYLIEGEDDAFSLDPSFKLADPVTCLGCKKQVDPDTEELNKWDEDRQSQQGKYDVERDETDLEPRY